MTRVVSRLAGSVANRRGCSTSAAAPGRARLSGLSGRPQREPAEARSPRGVAVLASTVILTGLLAAASASAQTSDITTPTENDDGSHTLWKATLTVEEYLIGTTSNFGYDRALSKGTLSSDAFTIGGTNYPVYSLVDGRGLLPELEFSQITTGFPAERSNWVLYLDGTAFRFSDSDNPGALTIFEWSNPTLNWADGDTVAVRLVRLNAPAAPGNLTAQSVANTQINLSWTAPSKTGGSDIAGYKIEVSTDGGDNWTDLVADTESTDTEYSHRGLSSGNTRHYRVSAINDIGTGAVSNEDSATAMSPAGDITTPTENDDGSHTLWKATLTVEEYLIGTTSNFGYDRALSKGTLSSDAFTIGGTNYPVYSLVDGRGLLPELEFSQITTGFPAERSNWVLYLDGTAFRFSDSDTPGALTIFEWSNPTLNWADGDTVAVRLVRLNAPAAPGNLTAQSVANTQINLSWTAPSKTGGSDIAGYKIEVSTDGGDNWTDLVADTESTDTEYSHRGLSSGNTRHYRVSAINDIGTGAVSNEDSATAMSPAGDITTPTENDDGSHTLWKATLTVEEYLIGTTSNFGYDRALSKGTLSSDAFTIGGTNYPVYSLVDGRGLLPELEFSQITTGFPAERSNWVLYLDGTAFRFSDSDTPGALTIFEWSNPTLNWADGDDVAVRLVRLSAPTAPRNLTAKGHSNTQIDLSWRAPEKTGGDISGYKIEVSTDSSTWADLVADTESMATTYSHKGLSSGNKRYYRVSAINAAGTGGVSNVASATAVATAPGLRIALVERTNSMVVRLEFDEVVDTTSVPDKSAFTVKVKGKGEPIGLTSFTITDAGSLGWIGLASRLRPGQEVTLSYTKPGSNMLKDAAADETPSFADYPVINELSNDFPILSVRDEEVRESGDSTTRAMTFTVRVDTEPDFAVGVYYETEDVSATGGKACSGSSPPDYISTEGRLRLGPGETSKEVVVTVCDDNVEDGGETFRLDLFSTQLHEPIDSIGQVPKSYIGEITASATGTILNSETTTEVSIVADEAYAEEGTEVVFTLLRAGDAEEALTVPVSVAEDGAVLGTPVPASVAFAAGSRQAALRVPTDDDDSDEADSRVTATVKAGFAWQVAEDAASAAVMVLDNDAPPVEGGTATEVTIWSADMTVVEYGPRSIGAGSADLFSNQRGRPGMRARWLWYDPSARELRLAFDDGVDDADSLTLHVGEVSMGFPENTGGNSSFTFEDVDVSWTAGDTLAARISKPSTETVSTDATLASLAVEGATLSPAFDAGVLVYRAAVEAGVETVTVTASANDGGAAVAYGPAEDADAELADHQVATPEGETLVEVAVTAADGRTARRYRVVLARAADTVTVAGSGQLSVADAEATEEDDTALEFVVTLNPAASDTVTVDYATSDGTATAGEDYTATSGTLTFAAGDTTKTVSVPIIDDTVDDGGETFTLTLSNASGAGLGDAEATGTILNAEAAAE